MIKDFDSAKQRLRPAMGARSRRALARRNAQRAVEAASGGDHLLVVTGSDEVAEMATGWGAEVLVEPREEGQNVAARRGINRAVEKGAEAVLVLSSDLPLVREGQSVRVSTRGLSRTATANVVFVNPLLDKETRTARVVAALAFL